MRRDPSTDSTPVPGRPAPWRRALHRHRRPVLAGLAGLLVWSLTTVLRPAAPELVPVLVAAHDLAPGATLAAGDLTTALLPDQARPADAPATADLLVGRRVVVPLRSGDAVLARHLLTSSLLSGYGPDTVATPLRLADDSALTVLRPGDVVDVIAAASAGASTTGGDRASVVASRVRVLITSAVAAGEAGLLSSSSSGSGASSLILATTPAQALEIARAAVGSRLSVVLRAS